MKRTLREEEGKGRGGRTRELNKEAGGDKSKEIAD